MCSVCSGRWAAGASPIRCVGERILVRHPRYISPLDIHIQRFIPLGRIN
ncbi:hypothetical protein [Bathymodiolus platifrons methanotrophic gill symbiont]|nr:hypothetical protein [Bathymodiolus platifrons methanotrophic gill symbiont]